MSFVTWFVYMVYHPISQMIPEAGDYFIYVVYAVNGLFLLLVLFSRFRIISFLIPKLRQRIFDKTYIKMREERIPFPKKENSFLSFIFYLSYNSFDSFYLCYDSLFSSALAGYGTRGNTRG